jgi:hypothetical protein
MIYCEDKSVYTSNDPCGTPFKIDNGVELLANTGFNIGEELLLVFIVSIALITIGAFLISALVKHNRKWRCPEYVMYENRKTYCRIDEPHESHHDVYIDGVTYSWTRFDPPLEWGN